jgi:hypothetical protein
MLVLSFCCFLSVCYSFKKYKSLDDIKKAAGTNGTKNVKCKALQFAIPNDGTNMSRGIKLLESAGLIEVKVPLDLICYVL